MVVLAASGITKSGKALVSRQFVDMTRIRIEGLLAAFPKLFGSWKQHTYVETEYSLCIPANGISVFGAYHQQAKVLMLSKHTAIDKSFLVPLLALEAPGDVISWIRGDYGLWTSFLAFLVRLFYYIPGELELPFLFVLLVIIAPYQAMNLRGIQSGMVISIVASAYLIYQHVTRTGIKKAFDQGVVVPTIAAACLICVPFIFVIKGYIF